MKPWLPQAIVCTALSILATGCANGPHAKASGGSAALAPDSPAYAKAGVNPNGPYSVLETEPKLLARAAATTTDLADAEACLAEQLAVFEVAANVEGNHRSVTLGFVNRGASACKVGGYPEVRLLDSHHQVMANVVIEKVSATTLIAGVGASTQPASSTTPAVAEVLLAPHSEADFQIGWTTGAACPEIAQVLVAAPGTHHLFVLSRHVSVCEGLIQITALQPDSAG